MREKEEKMVKKYGKMAPSRGTQGDRDEPVLIGYSYDDTYVWMFVASLGPRRFELNGTWRFMEETRAPIWLQRLMEEEGS